jgi:ribosome-binding protein aMBF1 (putative translation factor)
VATGASTTSILVGAFERNPDILSAMSAKRRRAAAPALRRLGARIRELRVERGLSQEALAFESDVAVNSIATSERGEANPSVAVLLAISRVLKVKLRDLVDDL